MSARCGKFRDKTSEMSKYFPPINNCTSDCKFCQTYTSPDIQGSVRTTCTMEKIKLLLLHEVSWDIVECTCCERKMKVGISRHTRLQDVFRVYDEEIKNILRQFEQYIEDEIERETIQLYDARYKRLSEEKELNLYWSPLENDDVPEDEKKNPIMSTTPKDQKKRAMSTSPEDGKKYAMSVCPEDQQLDDIDMQ